MSDGKYFSLQNSESVIANMAAKIFSAYISNQSVTETNENEMIKKAVHIATKMAHLTDKTIKSDGEWQNPEEKVTPVKI